MASPAVIGGSTDSVAYNSTAVTSVTRSYTCPSGTNRLLVVWLAGTSSSTPTSATFNGTAMIAGTDFTESQVFGRYFYLVNPTATTANVVVNFPSSTRYSLCIATYQDVDQTTPLDGVTPVNGTGTGTSGNLTVTTATNNAKIIYFLGVGNGATVLAGGDGGTKQVEATTTGADVAAWSDEEVAVAGSATTGMSWTGSAGWDANMISLRYDNVPPAVTFIPQVMIF